jgi:DNA polymerase V
MYALVDCNNFYASCERLFQPWMNGKPVVVLSNNDGCVIARSNEAKAIGIEMGALPFMIEDLLAKHQVEVRSSNYVLYGDMSSRVMATLDLFSPNVEHYSIDESFLDLHDLIGVDLFDHGVNLRATVHQHTGIPVSVGIASTKTLAKAANKRAKKTSAGVFVIPDEQTRIEVLSSMDVGDIWGVGHRNAYKLRYWGIHTALDFANAPRSMIRGKLTVVGSRLQDELNGTPCADLELEAPPKQEICTSRSFGKMMTDYDDLEEATLNFTARCALKLRKQRSAANVITVFAYTNRFREDLAQYNGTRSITLPVASNDTAELCHYARIALKSIFRPGYRYKKTGCIVQNLVPERNVQSALFDVGDRDKKRKVMEVMDLVNRKYGRDRMRVGAQGYGKRWHLRCEQRSRAYTTRLSELLEVNVDQ